MTKILAVPGEGERLDRFELVAELAQGGMATVYLARFVGVAGFKRFVAIKRLHPHLAKEHEFIQMFLDEARLAARLHHPNVVPILEIGVHDDQYYLVMEYIEGDTVGHLQGRAMHAGRKIPVPIVIRIMLDALTGLHCAHDLCDDDGHPLEIVHRDVSPQNILVGVDGVGRITDFGVAKAQARLANATQGGQLKGKLAYMSPEQVRGNMTVDRRADVFAAAIVLWELFTGQRLFKAEGEAETLFKVVAAEVPPIRNYEPGVPPEVEVVVKRALAANPNDRFASAADFAEALEQAARTYNLVATVRQTATFVNEMIGLDISQQREIVRAWIGRSELSKSGVAKAPTPPPAAVEPPTPHQGVPAAKTSGEQLSSLVDDDLDMATRVDGMDIAAGDDEEDATRIGPSPQIDASRSGPVPQAAAQLISVGGSGGREAYQSIATAREFQVPAMPPPLQPPPQMAWPQAIPQPGAQPQAAAPKRGLPIWTLLIPAALIIGGAVFLGLRAHEHAATAPQPSTTATTTPTQTVTAEAPLYHPADTATVTAPSASATVPAITTTSVDALPKTHTAPTPTGPTPLRGGPTLHVVPHSQPRPTNLSPIDNHEFGGRN